jgi:sulfate/thiosulfate transport system substrate-binding protein
LAENPISLVDKIVDKRNTRALAQAYLDFHYSEDGQEIAVGHNLRPQVESVAVKHKTTFKQLDLFTVDEVFGSWAKAEKTHFADGGLFDQIYDK